MADVGALTPRYSTQIVWSAAQLQAQFASCSARSIIVDLTRRGLAPFEAARQVTAHFETTPQALLQDLPPVLLPSGARVTAAQIGSWIDFELFGDPARILADRVRALVAERDVDQMLVLMPATPSDLTRADGLLLAQLVDLLSSQDRAAILAYPKSAYALPDDLGLGTSDAVSSEGIGRTPQFAPGPESSGLRSKVAMLGGETPEGLTAPNGFAYIAPCDRFVAKCRYPETLSHYAADWGWGGLPYLIDTAGADTLARFAWKALEARDVDLAVYLARQAVERDGDQAFARTALATILIIGQSFSELAQIPGDPEDLNRAWGETLAGDAKGAVMAFDQSASGGDTAMDLYLQNISALADFRTGNRDLAWSKQMGIRAALDATPDASSHLRFINHLNIGRLARAKDDMAEAASNIAQAFKMRGALLSEHDAFYREILLADVAASPAAAQTHWAEAADIFARQAHPGAISIRAFRKVVSRPPRPFELREHAVALALQHLGSTQDAPA